MLPILLSLGIYYTVLGLCDNGKTLYLDNADNALQNYLDNDSYCDKITIGYYAYILDFCNSKIALCTNIFVCPV